MNADKKNQLIERIKTIEGLEDEERSALLELLRTKTSYGLVWENKPEDVEEKLRDNIPVLTEVVDKALVKAGPDAPNHTLIEGDNLEALTTLAYTHAGKIDVIYIDPPYNTGNKDFTYYDDFNDDYRTLPYVEKEDSYRHSKWLSFMNRRLCIARKLLSDRGVIFISIDDNEQANLKLLCDEIFGENNFVCSFIWRGGKRNMSKWVSTSHEYMLMYAFNLQMCNDIGVEWHEKKRGLDDIYKAANRFVVECNHDYEKASKRLKDWFRTLAEDNPSKDHKHYCHIDERGVYFASDISRGGGGGPTWQIINPMTGQVVKTPARGWAYPTLEALKADINNNMVHFNGDGVPCKKRYLKDNETQILETVFYKDRRASSKRLREILKGDLFPFPKDDEILSQKFASFSLKSSIILDFFAGSGTTLHAVMQLNAEDGGHRQCILVTNNENDICEKVTYERNKRVIEGYTKSNGEHVEGLSNNNLRYYKTALLNKENSHVNRRALFTALTDVLCFKEDIYHEEFQFGDLNLSGKNKMLRYFTENDRKMLIIYDSRVIKFIVNEISKLEKTENPVKIFIYADGMYPYTEDFKDVLDRIELIPMPYAFTHAIKGCIPEPIDQRVDQTELSEEEQQEMLAEAVEAEIKNKDN